MIPTLRLANQVAIHHRQLAGIAGELMAMASLAAMVLLTGLLRSLPLPASCGQAYRPLKRVSIRLAMQMESHQGQLGRRSKSTHATGQAGRNLPANRFNAQPSLASHPSSARQKEQGRDHGAGQAGDEPIETAGRRSRSGCRDGQQPNSCGPADKDVSQQADASSSESEHLNFFVMRTSELDGLSTSLPACNTSSNAAAGPQAPGAAQQGIPSQHASVRSAPSEQPSVGGKSRKRTRSSCAAENATALDRRNDDDSPHCSDLEASKRPCTRSSKAATPSSGPQTRQAAAKRREREAVRQRQQAQQALQG